MKKKGRICGTIGLILSLALAGGTVVYGALFDANSVGKAEKPFGETTGNVFDGWFNKTGFDETKKLVDESGGIFDGTGENTKYTSYSLSFRVTETVKTDKAGKVTIVNAYREGVVYTDNNYTYLKLIERSEEGRTATVTAGEYVLAKKDSAWYKRTNTAYSALSGNVRDIPLLDKAKWTKSSEAVGTEAVFYKLSEVFQSVSATNGVYIDMAGEYYFKNTAMATGDAKSECRFTVGLCPTIRYTYDQPEKEGVAVVSTVAYEYSNLNNTKVSLPGSLEEAMK